MTRVEFKSKVNEALVHTSRLIVRSGVPVAFIQMVALAGAFYVLHRDPRHALLAFAGPLALDTAVLAVWLTRVGKEFSMHAPSCPTCARHLGLLERRRVVARGICPQCNGALYES